MRSNLVVAGEEGRKSMKSVQLLALASLCIASSSAFANERIDVSGTFSGAGAIVGFSVDEEGNEVFIVDEAGNYFGSLVGSYTYPPDDLERAIVDPETGAGTYRRTILFTGTVEGVACSLEIMEHGTVDLLTTTFEGHWHIKSSTCGVKGQGSVGGALTFFSEFEYTIEGIYAGWIKF
jgi:hypothetical protein